MLTPIINTSLRAANNGTCARTTDSAVGSNFLSKTNFGLPSLAPVFSNPVLGIFTALGTVVFFAAIRKSLAGISGVLKKSARPALSSSIQSTNISFDQGLDSALTLLTRKYQRLKDTDGEKISASVVADRENFYKNQLRMVLSHLESEISTLLGIDISSSVTADFYKRIAELNQHLTILNNHIENLKNSSINHDYTDLISQFKGFVIHLNESLADKFNQWRSNAKTSAGENARRLQDRIALKNIDDHTINLEISDIFKSETPFDCLPEVIKSLLNSTVAPNTECMLSNACLSFRNAVDQFLSDMKTTAKELRRAHEVYHRCIAELKNYSDNVDQISTHQDDRVDTLSSLHRSRAEVQSLAVDQSWRTCAKEQFRAEKENLLAKIDNTIEALQSFSPSAGTSANTTRAQSPTERQSTDDVSVYQTPPRSQEDLYNSLDDPIFPAGTASQEGEVPTPASELQPSQGGSNILNSASLEAHNRRQNNSLSRLWAQDADGASHSETETDGSDLDDPIFPAGTASQEGEVPTPASELQPSQGGSNILNSASLEAHNRWQNNSLSRLWAQNADGASHSETETDGSDIESMDMENCI